MTAEEAKKLTARHSKRVQAIYKSIEKSAKSGNRELAISTSEASYEDLEALRKNGFIANYDVSEIDGGQFILIKW